MEETWSSQTVSEDKLKNERNVSALWSDFTQSTGFHGVNKLTQGGRVKFRCVWWIIAIMCMTAYMTYNITKELMNFYNYPTVTSVNIEFVDQPTFPAITFCNLSPYNSSKVRAVDPDLQEYFKQNSYFTLRIIDWTSEFLGPTFRDRQSQEWWRNMSMDPDVMYITCIVQGSHISPCGQIMKPFMTKHGLCHTINFGESNSVFDEIASDQSNLIVFGNVRQDDYSFSRQLAAGIRVILHEPDIHPDSVTSSFLISPGKSTSVVVSKSTFKYLPAPYKATPSGFCIDTQAEDFKNPLEYFLRYTYNHCLMECVTNLAYSWCNCTIAQEIGPDEPLCSIYELADCYNLMIVGLGFQPEILEVCGCQMECSFSTYDAKVSASEYPTDPFYTPQDPFGENLFEVRIYYEAWDVHTTKQLPKYSKESLVGSIGGHMGFCLGASILTLTELIEFFLSVIVCVLRKIKRRSKTSPNGSEHAVTN